MRDHQAEQERERTTERELWLEQGWVFATSTGQPINPRTRLHRVEEAAK